MAQEPVNSYNTEFLKRKSTWGHYDLRFYQNIKSQILELQRT